MGHGSEGLRQATQGWTVVGPSPPFQGRNSPPWASQVAQTVKNLPLVQETQVRSLGWEDSLEKEVVIHSSILAWRIPWQRSLVGYSPWGCKRIGHIELLKLSLFIFSSKMFLLRSFVHFQIVFCFLFVGYMVFPVVRW